MTGIVRIRMLQMNSIVGDFQSNLDKLSDATDKARTDGITFLVAPELALTGYPPEDLLLRPALLDKLASAERTLCEISRGITLFVGSPSLTPNDFNDSSAGKKSAQPASLFNSLLVFCDGQQICSYHKQSLPNYKVFDERRYFAPGEGSVVYELEGLKVGLLICEDVWIQEIFDETCRRNVDLIFVVNASPFAEDKIKERHRLLSDRSKLNQTPVAYVNLVGGQDELVFDGGSFATNRFGEIVSQAGFFSEDTLDLSWDGQDLVTGRPKPVPEKDELLYQALVTGVRDYFKKTGFNKALLGLSGGIDSALTLAVAVDALGAENVHAIMMPYLYTADISVIDARRQAEKLCCEFSILPIEPIVREFSQILSPFFEGYSVNTAEENLQSRCRAVLLMALSNKTHALVLTTGNKSEMAVGYATLYGDMAGGFSVLKDVWKTRVYDLARYVNRQEEVIPERVIIRPPSAELAPGQKDADSLPPYDRLDKILALYIESDLSPSDIVGSGYQEAEVKRMCHLVDTNEHKRRQSPVGPRVTTRGFGRDRRYPIANRWSF